ncbi:GNAT superfamily N-acetyltransferase [Paenibacillus mucilaginosus]|uniref:GNAT family N-acetyltransferase n=1 Tax=Paenibacillus mucilaginosus TaxID=61624 RepID=UPI003D1AB885
MIREAAGEDADTLAGFYRELAPSSRNVNVLPERVEQIRRDPNNFLFIYEEEGIPLGRVFLTLCMDPGYEFRPNGVIEYMVVAESARGRGIGSALLEHAERLCATKHCTRVSLMSGSERTEAHRFYESRGYKGTASKAFKKYIRVTPVNWPEQPPS